MPNIKIFTDTSSDMPADIQEKYNIGMLRFLSVFDGKSYVSGKDITNAEFYDMLKKADKIPTTAQTPFIDMYDALSAAAREYDSVIYFTISSKGSGQYTTACMVKNEILENDNPDAKIYIVDSMKYSLFLTAAAVKAAEMAENGADAEEIIEECKKELESWDVFLLVDSLEYLEKGGRINKAKAIIGSLLDIKPVLSIREGLIESVDKMRGKKRVLEKLCDMMLDADNYDADAKKVMIVHSDAEKAAEMTEILKERAGIDAPYITGEFGPIVGTHTGPGAIALIYKTR